VADYARKRWPESLGISGRFAPEYPPRANSPIRAQVARLAIVLLYTAGLRRGELLRLTLGDVDREHGTLRIRESKFHKSRTVPLSASARTELDAYLRQRHAPRLSDAPSAPLLCNTNGGQRAYTGTGISEPIKQLYDVAGVRGRDGRRPRIHDFRHSFAVQALLRWYREGADVQSKLPHLAMYMGHVSIVSTAYYLKLVPEVAEMASARFEAHYGHLISGGPT
jgi:integrase/recombinase XerD